VIVTRANEKSNCLFLFWLQIKNNLIPFWLDDLHSFAGKDIFKPITLCGVVDNPHVSNGLFDTEISIFSHSVFTRANAIMRFLQFFTINHKTLN
jgi:hypothetical protein